MMGIALVCQSTSYGIGCSSRLRFIQIFTIGYLAEIFIGWADFGLGKPGSTVTIMQIVQNLKVGYTTKALRHCSSNHASQLALAVVLTYLTAIAAIKASIALLYLRFGRLGERVLREISADEV